MKISVLGLGYVGCVSAACLAKEGHKVIGVDINPMKVDMINSGKSPIIEKGLDDILQNVVAQKGSKGTLSATTNVEKAIFDTDISLICVGTPSNPNGSLKLDHVRNCSKDIGKCLKIKTSYHVVVARSTMLPGSVTSVVMREIETCSGKKAGKDFGVVMNPEFLRESSSIEDFYHPSLTVIGELDERSGDTVKDMYAFLDAPFIKTDITTAEMIKYANNSFHALKVSFANEIGALCKEMTIDSHKVMDIVCMDKKLNISPYYLKPGFAFGGSCLPKDLRALTYKAKDIDVDIPVLQSILQSNKIHVERVVNRIIQTGMKKVGILGLSFKPGSDDLRESPLVTLTETLIGKGFDIQIYDKNISVAKLFGANKEFIETELPHISSLMSTDLDTVVANADIIVIGHKSQEFSDIIPANCEGKTIFDLVRVADDIGTVPPGYEGICW